MSIKNITICLLSFCLIFTSYFAYKYILSLTENYTYQIKKENLLKRIKWESKKLELNKPFVDRINSCSDNAVLELISLIGSNSAPFYYKKIVCKTGILNSSVLSEFKNIYSSWPDKLKQLAEDNILQIYIVNNFKLSGMIIPAFEDKFVIVIDERILSETPNEWFSTGEGKGYIIDKTNIKIESIIESPQNQSPAHTFENVLIHELGHCFGVVSKLTPSLNGIIKLPSSLSFFDEIYELNPISFTLTKNLESINNLNPFRQNKYLPIEKYIELIEKITNSSFPTTYSIGPAIEFFAEYFYCYIHCEVQKKPLVYQIFDGDKLIKSLDRQVNNSLLKPRYDIILKALNNVSSIDTLNL